MKLHFDLHLAAKLIKENESISTEMYCIEENNTFQQVTRTWSLNVLHLGAAIYLRNCFIAHNYYTTHCCCYHYQVPVIELS